MTNREAEYRRIRNKVKDVGRSKLTQSEREFLANYYSQI